MSRVYDKKLHDKLINELKIISYDIKNLDEERKILLEDYQRVYDKKKRQDHLLMEQIKQRVPSTPLRKVQHTTLDIKNLTEVERIKLIRELKEMQNES